MSYKIGGEELEHLQEFMAGPGYNGLKRLVSAQIDWQKEKLCTTDIKDDKMLLIERASLDGAKKIQKFIEALKNDLSSKTN